MRKQIDTLDATPSKRVFYSIIADYDLNRSICELVDNGFDVWVRGKRSKPITISVNLDTIQQTITVEDNAGGLPKSDLRFIIGPGETGTNPTDETIGIFGVGSKRAVVALAQEVRITTRFPGEASLQIAFDDRWINDPSWELEVFRGDPILEGTTIVELHKLREQATDDAVEHLRDHLRTTYAKFLTDKAVSLKVNGELLKPKFFDNWAYPPHYQPRRYIGKLVSQQGEVRVEAIAGLSRESSPATGEYGVYFYCNNRLIARGLKTFDVGFTRGFAGLPHPKVSLTRVLVSLNGDARDMPWNSSKSDISTKHHIFSALHDWLVQVVKYYATLSRNWMGEWPEQVFAYKKGTVVDVSVDDFPAVKKTYLPPLPKSRPRYSDIITQKNKVTASKRPWTRGLYEGVIAADLIAKHQRLEQKNRIALIVLDSTLEIGFKEYLVNESGEGYSEKRLMEIFGNRTTVHNEVKKHAKRKISKDTWIKITYYYLLRNKLVHEKATVSISDQQVDSFRGVVEGVLHKLFALRFDE